MQRSQIAILIEAADKRLANEGADAAPTDAVLVSNGVIMSTLEKMCGILENIRDNGRTPGTKKDIVIRLGAPMAVGGGVIGIILAILEKLVR